MYMLIDLNLSNCFVSIDSGIVETIKFVWDILLSNVYLFTMIMSFALIII